MRRGLIGVTTATALAAVVPSAVASPDVVWERDFVPGEVIVGFAPGLGPMQ